MKKIISLFTILLSLNFIAQESKETKQEKPKKTQLKNEIVEASCGQCQFGLKYKGCDLAIRFQEKVYYVVGTTIDNHGDAHAKDGFCNAIRKAKVSGTVKNGKFLVKKFELLASN